MPRSRLAAHVRTLAGLSRANPHRVRCRNLLGLDLVNFCHVLSRSPVENLCKLTAPLVTWLSMRQNSRQRWLDMQGNVMRTVIIATLLMAPMAAADAYCQDLQSRLNAPVTEYSLAAPSLIHAVHKLATDLKLPIGVEWVRDSESLRPVRLSWSGTRVSNVLTRLVAEYPQYKISLDGSIVHVFRGGVRNILTDALSVRLGPIEINDEPLAAASGFRVLPRLQRVLQPALPVSSGEGGSIASGPGGDRRVNVKSTNPTLREILDMLAVSAGEVIWVVRYPPHGQAEGRWQLTETLGGRPVPPHHQPHWTFLPWGPPSIVKVSGMEPGPIKR